MFQRFFFPGNEVLGSKNNNNASTTMPYTRVVIMLLYVVGLSGAVQLQSLYSANKKLLVIRKPAVKITTDFTIKLK